MDIIPQTLFRHPRLFPHTQQITRRLPSVCSIIISKEVTLVSASPPLTTICNDISFHTPPSSPYANKARWQPNCALPI